MSKLYRITYNGKGIYQVLKEFMGPKRWHDFLNSEISTWLPNPGEELYKSNDCITFFTEEGYKEFVTRVEPFIYWYHIPIEINIIPDINDNLLYSDKYQKVFKL